jgi:hypothetical protein
MMAQADGDEKSWIREFHKLSFANRLKAKEAIYSLLSSAVDLATAVPLAMTFVAEDEIEKEEALATMLSGIRRATYALRDTVKDSVLNMAKVCCDSNTQAKLPDMFTSKKEIAIKDIFGFELYPDFRKRVQDVMLVCMPKSCRKEDVPDTNTLDFKVV